VHSFSDIGPLPRTTSSDLPSPTVKPTSPAAPSRRLTLVGLLAAPAYAGFAAWHWVDCVEPFLASSANQGVRSYTVQYRESDLAFVQRLLAREGLALRVEPHGDSPAGHRVVIFADSVDKASCPEDLCSASGVGGAGIRYHRASSQEEQDSIQAFGGQRRLQASRTVALSWDYKAKRAVAAEVTGLEANAGENAPSLEHYSALAHHGSYAWPDAAQAQRAALHIQQSLEARHKTWLGRGTVRSFAAGAHFTLTESDMALLDALQPDSAAAHAVPQRHRFLLTQVEHLGINNLPKELSQQIAKALGEPEALEAEDPSFKRLAPELLSQAARSGYANRFEAIRAAIPWRPWATAHPSAKTEPGTLTATVVGPDGQTQASGADALHMDVMGRIRIRFDFQAIQPGEQTSPGSTWVRVLHRFAGSGLGAQFIPRVGQQVLVEFINGDIERPLVVGSLYDGQGEGGLPATPGGIAAEQDASPFKTSTDPSSGAQGNQTAGRSPAWHGQSPEAIAAGGQANAAALSGYKSAEFGNESLGFNQLVFDDTTGQLRTQLSTTQHASQLNLGHLIHQADNHRGSFRGLGFELRTDAYGAVRAASGILLSTFNTQAPEPAGDNAAGMALQNQLTQLAKTLSQAAKTHQATSLAADIGSFKATQATISDKEAPAKALHTSVKGMVAHTSLEQAQQDAQADNTQTGEDKVPHTQDPIVLIAAQAGQAIVAGQDIQIAANEVIHLASGQDTHIATGAAARIHAGQSIGILAGAQGPGSEAQGKGFTLIAGQGDIDIQAQAEQLQIAAKQAVSVQSKSSHIDWAAAKKITLATAGGASVTIEGGNITVECPGKITIKAGKRSFVGPERHNHAMPKLPAVPIEDVPVKFNIVLQDVPGPHGVAAADTDWRIVRAADEVRAPQSKDEVLSGTSDAQGRVALGAAQEKQLLDAYNATPGKLWLVFDSHARNLVLSRKRESWTEQQQLHHALDAMGYSDDLGTTGVQAVAEFHEGLARAEHKTNAAAELLNKTKGA
jgi:type VI secretion system secreted protein VgrG